MRRHLARLFFLLLLLPPLAAHADEAERAVALVEQTARALERDVSATLEAINRAEAPYQDPADATRYVFVYDMTLTIVAHPNPELVGKNKKGVPDAHGKLYRDEILAGALREGKGWEDYYYSKPGHPGVHPKRSFYERVTGSDGRDYIVAAGVYLD